KDYKGAIQFFDNALANGDFWFYNQKKGEALWEVDDYKGAVEQFSRVIRDKPGYKRAWWMRAQAYKMLSQFPEALADMNYTISIEPNDDLAIAARGYILQISGNLVSALEDYRNAAKLNPTNTMHQDAIREIQQLMSSVKS
ncbi:MAG TPA: tetratricopeptide repeat protein, partial [Methylobacter sp.]